MPDLEFFLVCESISVDKSTNRLSMFNVLEDFVFSGAEPLSRERSDDDDQATAAGHILGQFVAVALLNRSDGDEGKEFTAKLLVEFPGDAKSVEKEMPFTLEKYRHRLVVRFVGLPNIVPGQIKFSLSLDGEHMAKHIVNALPGSAIETTE